MAGKPYTLLDRLVLMLATGCGFGYSKYAPGTVGSLWGPPMMWAWQALGLHPAFTAAFFVVMAAIGIPICRKAADLMHSKDPGGVVFDEIVAFIVVFAFVPVTWVSAVIGFLWFRLFDILKPWPVRELDRLPGGIGIMADDLAAGVYAAGALWVTMWLVSM